MQQIFLQLKNDNHIPELVIENKNYTMLCDFGMKSDKEIRVNRPDNEIKDKTNIICF